VRAGGEPFEFLVREKLRPKSIMQVRLEQDLAVRAQVEEAELSKQFRANPLPRTTTEPLYDRMVHKAERDRERRKAENVRRIQREEDPYFAATWAHILAEQKERKERVRQVHKLRQEAFKRQKPRSRPAPPRELVEQRRQAALAAEQERAARIQERARRLREESSMPGIRAAEEDPKEKVERLARARAERAKKLRGRDVSLGYREPPNFKELHRQFDDEMKRKKQQHEQVRPEPFHLHANSSDYKEKAAQRERKVHRDTEVGKLHQQEALRWPHVQYKPPPDVDYTPFKAAETRSQKLRQKATEEAKKAGQYDPRMEKEMKRRQKEEAERERNRRFYQHQLAKRGGDGGGGDDFVDYDLPDEDKPEAARGGKAKAKDEGIPGVPRMYLDARKKQVEAEVKDYVDELKLKHGVYDEDFDNIPDVDKAVRSKKAVYDYEED